MTTKVSLIADNAVTGIGISNLTITADDIANNAVTTSKIDFGTALVPLGGIIMWSGVTAPSGYQLCNNSELPTNSPLRPTITNTPDLREKFIVGAGTNYAIGSTGGANSVQLQITQMPSHDHGGLTGTQSANHRHTMPGDDQVSFGTGVAGWAGQSAGNFGYDATSKKDGGNGTMWWTGYVDADHKHGIGLQGGGQAHENRPPYYALAFIMRVL